MKCKNIRLVCIQTLIALLVSNSALAEHLKLDDINVISEENLPLNKDYATTAGDAAKLLENEMGVSLYHAGGVSSLPVIHGLADDRIRIQVDGMDLISSCANHMNPPLSYISPANIGFLDVYAGISPVSLGGDSIAGTIQVSSEKPAFARSGEGLLTHAFVNAFYKSNNNARGVNLSASVANEDAYMRYTGSTVEANNYHAGGNFKAAGLAASGRGWLDGDEVGSSYYQSIHHALAFGLHRDNHLFEFKLGLQSIPNQGFANQRMDMTDNDAQQYNFKYEGKYHWGKLEAQAYHERVRHSMQFGEDKLFWYGAAGNVAGMPMDTLGRTTGIKLKGSIDMSERDLLKVGVEYQRYRLDDYWQAVDNSAMMSPNTFVNINNGQRDHYDIYAEMDSQWSQQWFTQVGMRSSTVKMNADNVAGYNAMMYGAAAAAFNATDRSKTDNNIDITVLARFTPDSTQSYEAGYSIKTRSPNVYERYSWANSNSMVMNMNNWVGDGNGYVGNLNLNPETAHTLSVTAKWHDAANQDWKLAITPYFTYVDDYIDAVTCASIGKTCATRTDGFVNLSLDNQSARIYGIDIKGKKLINNGGDMGSFTATALLNYVRGENTETDDDLYNIMPLNAKFGVEHRLGGWKNNLEVKLVAAKDHTQAIRKENQTAGYSLMNFYTSYDWKKARFDLGVENLFDRKYEYPLGGAYIGQGATMMSTALAPQQGVQVPGMGRSVNVGVTLFY
ncbi:MAG: TonB-dependent receptor plug domain-containing protein [Methylophilus sp.]|nr:TonB-dependent receptor plug domain-containing protein [Methylophilus sp.]